MVHKRSKPASKGKMKKSRFSTKATKEAESSSPPRHNTRSQAKALRQLHEAVPSGDEDVEEIPPAGGWPKYKDDLPNAFNGEIDPSKDYISKLPVEIIDKITSCLLLDHDPDRGIKDREENFRQPQPHVLLSMAAMSRIFYYATEDFAKRFSLRNRRLSFNLYQESSSARKELRRSERIASIPQPGCHEVYRLELVRSLSYYCIFCPVWCMERGKLANGVCICSNCERREFGPILTLTNAMQTYDLRDYMLVKSRKPGPRAKYIDLPAIPYGTVYKTRGYVTYSKTVAFYFQRKDVEMIARLVHADLESHLERRAAAKRERQRKARIKRIKELKINHHKNWLELTSGVAARRHQHKIDQLLELPPHLYECKDEDGNCCEKGEEFCYHTSGLCYYCGDVVGRHDPDDCMYCWNTWANDKFDQYYGA